MAVRRRSTTSYCAETRRHVSLARRPNNGEPQFLLRQRGEYGRHLQLGRTPIRGAACLLLVFEQSRVEIVLQCSARRGQKSVDSAFKYRRLQFAPDWENTTTGEEERRVNMLTNEGADDAEVIIRPA